MAVEGNKFELAAVRDLLVLFGQSDFEMLMKSLGILKKDIKAAARTAAQRTQRWASREAARGIAAQVGVSYRGMRERTRLKMRYQSIGGNFPELRVWFGLNDVPWKFLGARETKRGVRSKAGEQPGGFIGPGGHAFVRVGKNRLPLRKLELSIREKGEAYIRTVFEPEAANHFMTEFFAALDRIGGRTEGATEAVANTLRATATRPAGQ